VFAGTLAHHARRIACVAAGYVLAGSIGAAAYLVTAYTQQTTGPRDIEAEVIGQLLLVILGPGIAFNVVGAAALMANRSWGPRTLRIGLVITAIYAAVVILVIVLSDIAAGQSLAASFLRDQLVVCLAHTAIGTVAVLFASFLRRPEVLRHRSFPATA
jgi:hypothetical protein